VKLLTTLFLLAACGLVNAQSDMRFATVDIYLDSREPVAAWQFELGDNNSVMQVVGVENGASPAFPRAPYYDRDAVEQGRADRIIVADYSLEPRAQLPRGRTRIATLHLLLAGAGEPDFKLTLVTANTHDGRVIDASLDFDVRTGSEK
jgi:hypothetical protein